MKKLLAVLLALVMVLSLAACGAAPAETPNTPAEPETPATEPAAEPETPAATGSVYYLNFKPEADEAWQKLAETYTAQTGVEVKVLTAASGTYEETLVSEMDKSAAPTLFQCNEGGVASWGEYCYDLSGTKLYEELASQDYALKTADGEVISIAYCLETFGIITNVALLEEAGHSLDEITNFESLKAVADDIHARADELGFDAFSDAAMKNGESWRYTGHLSNMPLYYEFRDDSISEKPATIKGTYLENYKNIWDLYTTDTAVTGAEVSTKSVDDSRNTFTSGKAVFYQNGSWEESALREAGMDMDKITMIPIYCGVEGEEKAGLCTGTENYWSVNKSASEEDINATLDFLYWVVTSEEGTTMRSEQFGPCPFKMSKEPTNIFAQKANEMVAEGCYPVTWAFNYTPAVNDWRTGVESALQQYTAGTGEWSAVETAFVQGWATQYAAENAG